MISNNATNLSLNLYAFVCLILFGAKSVINLVWNLIFEIDIVLYNSENEMAFVQPEFSGDILVVIFSDMKNLS